MKESLHKERPSYTQVTNDLIGGGYSLKAIGLYTFMFSKPHNWNFTINSMSKQVKDGPTSIRSAMDELKKSGWVSYSKKSDGSGVYLLRVKPKLENQHLEGKSQSGVFPLCENPTVGKSNRISNIDFNNNTNKNSKKDGKSKFCVPTIEEIKVDFLEKGSTEIEGEKFFYFYGSKNWFVGKNKMKNWKAAASGWISRNKKNSPVVGDSVKSYNYGTNESW